MQADLCVYGATAAGVIAAITAAKRGKTVVLVEPGRHIGGMTTGGLGWTDFGNKAAVGGRARDFYKRIGKHYEGKTFAEQGGKPAEDGALFVFEPSAAAKVLAQMLAEAQDHISLLLEHRVVSAQKTDGFLRRITVEQAHSGEFNQFGEKANGTVDIDARMFIDCSYEGDLMPRAGVSSFTGRESNAAYDETVNGIVKTHKHQFQLPVDPYIRKGDPDSGLIPLVSGEPWGELGGADPSTQAYNLRLCLTQRKDILQPIGKPPAYDPHRYEMFARYVAAQQEAGAEISLKQRGYQGGYLKIDPLPNDKTDINNANAVSTDFIGQNHKYPEGDYPTRGRIWREHVLWIWGLLHFIATDERLPKNLRDEMKTWGLCKDEFTDTGGWPHQLYVREARRLHSGLVMNENHCTRRLNVEDSIGLAAYQMDSHNCRRIVVDGAIYNEGDVQVPPTGPYPVGFRAIIPNAAECRNLLIPVCVSATHIAFGSIRMEPVFMVLAESAAEAACLAIDGNTSIQDLNYQDLRSQLTQIGQVLEFEPAK